MNKIDYNPGLSELSSTATPSDSSQRTPWFAGLGEPGFFGVGLTETPARMDAATFPQGQVCHEEMINATVLSVGIPTFILLVFMFATCKLISSASCK